MKCIICHSEDIFEKEVLEEFKDSNNVVFAPIKALECKSCGERYYSQQVMRQLEDIEKKISNHELELREIGKVMLAG
jgi:YgiT-type zinc finger domain-containing protein